MGRALTCSRCSKVAPLSLDACSCSRRFGPATCAPAAVPQQQGGGNREKGEGESEGGGEVREKVAAAVVRDGGEDDGLKTQMLRLVQAGRLIRTLALMLFIPVPTRMCT